MRTINLWQSNSKNAQHKQKNSISKRGTIFYNTFRRADPGHPNETATDAPVFLFLDKKVTF